MKPILFNGPMVRAILTGQKTQTRRAMKPQPPERGHNGGKLLRVVPSTLANFGDLFDAQYDMDNPWAIQCPLGRPGDRLWVRESAYIAPPGFAAPDVGSAVDEQGRRRVVGYAASMDAESVRCAGDYGVKCTPSIHMPRWASRITLEVTDVRVQRLDAITEEEAIAEGVEARGSGTMAHHAALRLLWCEIYGHASWDANPFVWAVTFRRVMP